MAKRKSAIAVQEFPEVPAAHLVVRGDPRVDGPYLDDIREDQASAYRESREKKIKEDFKKAEEERKQPERVAKARAASVKAEKKAAAKPKKKAAGPVAALPTTTAKKVASKK